MLFRGEREPRSTSCHGSILTGWIAIRPTERLLDAYDSESTDTLLGRDKVITCYGILGILSLATSVSIIFLRSRRLLHNDFRVADFLVVITSRTPSCRLLSQPIYLATDFRLLPLSPLSTSVTILSHPVEKELVALVEQGLKSGRMWFSYGLDLTNTMQRQQDLASRGQGEGQWPAWKRADERFFWNRFLMGKMIDVTENGGVDVSHAPQVCRMEEDDCMY